MDHATADCLAAAYRAGRPDALPPLVGGLARTLLAQAYRFVRDWDLAADLVQETWLNATEAIQRYDPARPFLPWIRTILRHRCLNHLARLAARPVPVALAVVGDPASERPADQTDHATQLADLRRRLARHLTALPASQREALVMVDLEEQSHAEAAAALAVTPASLRVILHRARRALAERLQREETT
jgi:RNA polymerase sigma-70 factor (ECF subfamily)